MVLHVAQTVQCVHPVQCALNKVLIFASFYIVEGKVKFCFSLLKEQLKIVFLC